MPTNKEERESGWLSVTQVLDAFIPKGLLDWYLKTGKKEAKRLSTVAIKIGSRVDELIQQDLTIGNKITSKDPIEVLNCFSAWQKFKKDYQPQINGIQVEVKDESQKLVGHIDLIIDGIVVDIKCSSSIKDNYWLQVAKYSQMWQGQINQDSKVAILRLDKNLGTYQFVKNEYVQELVGVYDGLLKAYRYYHPKDETEE